jgi:SWI/SNF-related matrix-associated actin-dependent regulator of chromatin subfamily A3
MNIDFEPLILLNRQDNIELQWKGDRSLRDTAGYEILQLPERISLILTTLTQNADLQPQFLLLLGEYDHLLVSKKISSSYKTGESLSLCVILYGPIEFTVEVGDWLDQCNTYLQLPRRCDRNVRYLNPHCLSFDINSRRMTFDLDYCPETSSHEKDGFLDSLTYLECEETFAESPQPALISTPLYGHQKQALTFMLGRERGWDVSGCRADLWRSWVDSQGTTRYQNVISGRSQVHEPSPFNGGILADDMGLGKTCTMLSLIASNPYQEASLGEMTLNREIKSTLVVVPYSLLQVWERQVAQHFHPSTIQVCTYHGPRRREAINEAHPPDIIITTYNTVAQDWKYYRSRSVRGSRSLLFSSQWHRVVLDEGKLCKDELQHAHIYPPTSIRGAPHY